MSYSFAAADGSVEATVRRVAVERIDDARAALAGADDRDEAVHTARKRMKELRSLVRLVDAALRHPRREDRDFRDIARGLSGNRDAAVLGATFGTLERDAPRPLDVDTAYAVRKALDDARTDGSPDDGISRAKTVALLDAARARVAAWSLEESGWAALADGLADTYASARNGMKPALRSGENAAMHEWRKDVKAHYHHLALLRPVWPAGIKPQVKAANRLQEALGDHHDLALLAAHLAGRADDFGGALAVEPILRTARDRQARLAQEAHALGARLFAEDAAAFAERIRGYWKEWRRETRRAADARLAA